MMQDLLVTIQNYQPFNEQEAKDKELFIEQLQTNPQFFTRESKLAHVSASAWIVSPDRKKVLMAYHNIYQSWAWLGGHADGCSDLKAVIKREIAEESGLTDSIFLSEDLFAIEVLTVDGHQKAGQYVSSHLHFNCTYLLEADPSLPLSIQPIENSQVAWLEIEKLAELVSEEWIQHNIYQKLVAKMNQQFPLKKGAI